MTGAIFLFNSLGAGFQALHLAGFRKELEAFELIPLGSQAQLLVRGSEKEVQGLLQQLSFADIEHVTVIPEWSQQVEKAFYSLDHAKPMGALVFVEGPLLGTLFEAAHFGLKSGLQIVDFKIPRGSVKWGLLILTASQVDEAFVDEIRARGCVVTRICQPSAALKDYFEIESGS